MRTVPVSIYEANFVFLTKTGGSGVIAGMLPKEPSLCQRMEKFHIFLSKSDTDISLLLESIVMSKRLFT